MCKHYTSVDVDCDNKQLTKIVPAFNISYMTLLVVSNFVLPLEAMHFSLTMRRCCCCCFSSVTFINVNGMLCAQNLR